MTIIDWLIDWCLAPPLAVFQLYLGGNPFLIYIRHLEDYITFHGLVCSCSYSVLIHVSASYEITMKFLNIFCWWTLEMTERKIKKVLSKIIS
jgi:hypothetical protein